MNLPFSPEQFLEVFKKYNTTVFPAQIIFYTLAILIIPLSIKRNKYSGLIISAILSFFWLWMGVVYHLVFFSTINNAAYFFGALFILQGFVLIYTGVYKSALTFKLHGGIAGILSSLLILYALIIYPLLGYFSGHVYPFSPTFGLPCPTTIFTLGILLLIDRKNPAAIFVIPLIWSVIGFLAAVKLGIYEDIGLLIAGVISIILLFYNSKTKKEVLT